MTVIIVVTLIALASSFLCSLLEAVILSVNSSYIEVKIKEGKAYAHHLKVLKANIDRPLAAILAMNTIVNTMGSAAIADQILKIWGDGVLAAASFVLTLLILFLSEITPKTLGALHWKFFTPFATYAIRIIIFILYPIVFVGELIASAIGGDKKHNVSREEMIATAEMGATHGTLKKKETTIIKNLLMLDNMYVYDIMTPRSVVMALSQDMTIEEVIAKYKPIRYSRIPVYSSDMDHIEGVVHRYQILEASSGDHDKVKLKEIMRPIHRVSENLTVSTCLDEMIQKNAHIFIVNDEYGSTLGIVTMEDAIETLLGVEIVDEFDSVTDLRAYALEKWRKRKKTFETGT